MRYRATDGQEIEWALLRALMASVADVVLFPMQDVLGLGSAARMNKPATPRGNWRWRLREVAGLYDRAGGFVTGAGPRDFI